MRTVAVAAVVYSAAAVLFTFFERLEHATFARSEFCSSPGLMEDAGHYAAKHCLGGSESHFLKNYILIFY